jgi:hypothetical protein
MPPPQIWGPAIWTLFHTLAEKINEEAYPYVYKQLFAHFQRICHFLPCPDCSKDATRFLANIKITNVKNKNDFKNVFYVFHNYVNKKTRKPFFPIENLDIYKRKRLPNVINNFLFVYNTKGNMKLLTESFQRGFVITEFKKWIRNNISVFFPSRIPQQINTIPLINTNNDNESIKLEIIETNIVFHEEITQEDDFVENNIVIQQEPVIPVEQEPVTPVEQELVIPLEQEPVIPVEQELVIHVEQEVVECVRELVVEDQNSKR